MTPTSQLCHFATQGPDARAFHPASLQLLIVGDFNIPAEPRDMHPSLGPYEESYGEEERAALAGLLAAYPGGPIKAGGVRCGCEQSS